MTKPRQFKPPSRTRKRALVIKLMVGGRGLSFSLSPVVLILLATACGLAFQAHRRDSATAEARYQARIDELEQENHRVQTFLARKEKEKRQMVALAQARSEELWGQLQQRDREMAQIWKVVGKAPQTPAPVRRHTLAGSRNGMHTLQVKRRYLELANAMDTRQSELDRLRKAARDYRREKARQAELALLNATPSLWPTNGEISSGFGYRIHPILGYGRFHSGLDICAAYGTPIVATAAGRVVHAGYFSGYGNAVIVDHGNGLTTLYGHCSSVGVSPGLFVKKGQTIAYVGSTGMSTGPHCHYEVSINGSQVDPTPYIKSHNVE